MPTIRGTISPSPDTSKSSSITLRNATSSSLPYSLNPIHKPNSSTGRPSIYNLAVSAVTAPATLNDTALITMAARLTGWETVRCMSFGQPRNWHQMVTMIPVSPVSPPSTPFENPMAMSAATPNFGAGASQLQWIVNAYLLLLSALLLLGGAAGDIFGRRSLLITV